MPVLRRADRLAGLDEDGHSYARCTSCRGVFTDIDESTYEGGRHNAPCGAC